METELVQLFDPATDTSISRADQLWSRVANRLRQEIFTGRWKPGSRIVETRVAAEVGVAQSSVREALHQLETECLISRVPNVGARVTQLSQAEVRQIYGLRAQLESYAVRLVGQKGDRRDFDLLDERLAACRRAVDDTPMEYMMRDLEFHLDLWRRTGNEFLIAALARIVLPLFALETRDVVPLLSRNAKTRNLQAHKEVVDHLRAGRIAAARRGMVRMIEGFCEQTCGLSR
jgi:DNA-binding GntR family transcriptional regulator